jgi:signal transduction histidine kinase
MALRPSIQLGGRDGSRSGGVKDADSLRSDDAAALRRCRVLTRMMSELLSAGDSDAILSRLVVHLVPEFGDWCLINVLAPDGTMRRHADARVLPAEKCRIIDEIRRRFPPSPSAPLGLARVLRSGVPELSGPLTPAMLRAVCDDPDYLALWAALGIQSYVAVPILVRGKVIGGLALDSMSAERIYTQADLAFAQDIAGLVGLAIERKVLLEEATMATRLKEEFIAVMSHELRTPLSAILGWTQLLLSDDSMGQEEKQRALQTIERNANQQCGLVDDLLDLSLAQCERLSVAPEPVDLVAVLREAVASIHPAAAAKRSEVALSLAQDRAEVYGDRRRLLQVFGNILANSAKFSRTEGHIEVTLERHGHELQVTVADDGIGIAPGFLPFVFERFRQENSSRSRSFGGLGLGMALAKRLVELHGGHIAVSSAGHGKGAAFTVTLPSA